MMMPMLMQRKKRKALSKFLPQGRQGPGDFKPDSAKPLFHDDDEAPEHQKYHPHKKSDIFLEIWQGNPASQVLQVGTWK